MELLGYLGALLVGLSLGILGAGGSIIAIPVLIYLFHIEPLHATTYSFFIIGCTAMLGAVQHIRNRTVQVMPAVYFAGSGIVSILLIRTYLIKLIPDTLFTIHHTIVTKSLFILLFFSIVMAISGISMIYSEYRKSPTEPDGKLPGVGRLIVLGFGVGIIIALAGVGGGFLITPALTLVAKVPVKSAIGTSLCIISLNSFVGFFSSLGLHPEIDWQFLLFFIAVTATGILLGTRLSRTMQSHLLKVVFGCCIILMSLFMVLNEFLTIS